MRKNTAFRLSALAIVLAAGGVQAARGQSTAAAIVGQAVPCVDGKAAGFDCRNVDLLSFLPVSAISGTEHDHEQDPTPLRPNLETARPRAAHHECHDDECSDAGSSHVRLNDIWGWTSPTTGKEYALVGRTEGTAFVDVSDPVNPVYLGELPTHADTSSWRDIKVYGNYAFIVADYGGGYVGAHGMQVFDLTQLDTVRHPHIRFAETTHYGEFGKAHNLFINEATGYAYAVGTATCGATSRGGGLHMIDVRNPLNPTFAGCFADGRTGIAGSGYSHDVQCVVYEGPDTEHTGREICIGSNETALSIADVTDKSAPVALSFATYESSEYAHQGWLTDDHRYFLLDDELDEIYGSLPSTRTIIWDVADLENPVVHAIYWGQEASTDHNQYVLDGHSYQANYKSGLRILDVKRIASASTDPEAIREAAFFDTYPPDNSTGFDGAWSNYPYYESGIVVVSSIGQGLFVLKPNLLVRGGAEPPGDTGRFGLASVHPNPLRSRTTLVLDVPAAQEVRIVLYDVLGRERSVLYEGTIGAGRNVLPVDVGAVPSGRYLVRATGGSFEDTQVITVIK